MPMALTGLDVHDITHIDLTLLALVCHHAGARGHDQHLVAVMGVPSRGATLAEVHHAAVIIRGVPGLNDSLTRPGNRSSPSVDWLAAFHWDVRYVLKLDHLHNDPLFMFLGALFLARSGIPWVFLFSSSSPGQLRRAATTAYARKR